MLFAVGHVEVVDGFGVGSKLTDALDGHFGGEVGGYADVLGGHDAASAVFGVGQQLAHVLGVFLVHTVEQVGGAVGREVAQHVGGFVGLHGFKDVGGTLGLD